MIAAKQARSRKTFQSIVAAVYTLLEQKFFEQISIAEISEQAGVSVGTFYRRFENKNALLPHIDRRYNDDFQAWMEQYLVANQYYPHNSRAHVAHLVKEILEFFQQRRGVMRTIHLYRRLHGGMVTPQQIGDRLDDYAQIDQQANTDNPSDALKQRMLRHVILASVTEWVLYPDVTPAASLTMDEATFVEQLIQMCTAYLSIEDQPGPP